MKSRPCPTDGCPGTCRRRPVCPDCWSLAESSCRDKFRHPRREAATAGTGARVGLYAYHCPVCRSWHSGSGKGAAGGRVPAALAASLTQQEREALAAEWAPATPGAGGRSHRNTTPEPGSIGQAVLDPASATTLMRALGRAGR